MDNIKDSNMNDSKDGNIQLDNLTWFTSKEAASYMRKTVNALRVAVHRGQICARRFNRRLYFKRSELDKIIDFAEIFKN